MVLKLGPTLALSGINEAKGILSAALVSGQPIIIDSGALTEIDFAGLQLLCATHRAAARQGQTLTFVGARRGVVIDEAIAALGFGRGDGCGDGCVCGEAPRG